MKTDSTEVKRIFWEVIENGHPENWTSLVDEACGNRPHVKLRVTQLLAAHLQTSKLVDAPEAYRAGSIGEKPGDWVHGYELMREIGEGSYGIVFLARQVHPFSRQIALKILKPGVDTRQVVRRFELEQETLALMDHPNIARVLDAGKTDSGRPYFVMEYVDGSSLTDYCRGHGLTINSRLELFLDVCQAVQHAHQKGIVHRDLKPSNILVAHKDGRPLVKVIDFGISKAIDAGNSQVTRSYLPQLLGTLIYMSPEQFTLGKVDVDTRSDLYSLGLVLYELFVGIPASNGEALGRRELAELAEMSGQTSLPRPSRRLRALLPGRERELQDSFGTSPARLVRQLERELDWIVLKAIEPERSRRYQSAGLFAEDIRRYLSGNTVGACPPSTWYQVRKIVAQHRLTLFLSLATCTGLLLATGFSGWMAYAAHLARIEAMRHLQNEQLAVQQANERAVVLRQTLYASDMRSAWFSWQSGQFREARELLDRYRVASDPNEDPRDFAWYYLQNCLTAELRVFADNPGPVTHGGLSADGRWVAGSDQLGFVCIWEAQTGKLVHRLHYAEREVNSVAFSPDSQLLATAGQDSQIHLWECSSWDEVRQLGAHDGTIVSIAWSPDGRRLASGGRDQAVMIWDAATGECTQRLLGLEEVVRDVDWSPNGSLLAAAVGPTVKLWDTATWKMLQHFREPESVVHEVAFRGDGRQLAAAGFGIMLHFYDVDAMRYAFGIEGRAHMRCLAFSPSGHHLVAGFSSGGPRIWKTQPTIHYELILAAAEDGGAQKVNMFSSDGQQLLTAIEETKQLRLWDFSKLIGYRTIEYAEDCLAASFQQQLVATQGADGSVQLRSLRGGELSATLAGHSQPVVAAAFSSSGELLATAANREILVWHVPTRSLQIRASETDWPVVRLQFSHNGQQLAAANKLNDVCLIDVASGKRVHQFTSDAAYEPSFAFSQDDQQLVFIGHGPEARVVSTADGKHLKSLRMSSLTSLAFSPNGPSLFVGGDSETSLWNLDREKKTQVLADPRGSVVGMAISADGRTLATVTRHHELSETYQLHLWNLKTGQQTITLFEHEHMLEDLSFTASNTLSARTSFGDSNRRGLLLFETSPQSK